MKTLAEKTYTLLSQVPRGRVTTYKALAERLGTRSYRAIGQIMHHNPYAPQIPCHRVVRSDGTIGGFMGKTKDAKIERKIKLLSQEGIKINNGRVANFKELLFKF